MAGIRSTMQNIKKRAGSAVERWMFSDEIAARQAENTQNPQGRKVTLPDGTEMSESDLKELLVEVEAKMKENMEEVKRQIVILDAEDHSKPPSQDDVDRYYLYHETFTANIKMAEEKIGMWSVTGSELISPEVFAAKAQSDGWAFLRRSCGLPQGKIGATPWNSFDSGEPWKVEEKG